MRHLVRKAILAACLLGVVFADSELKLDPMPVPLTLNAVTGYRTHSQFLLFSFMGIGPKKSPDDVTTSSYMLDLNGSDWSSSVKPVPGIAGRIAAMATSVRSELYVIGGYVVDSQNRGSAVPDVSRLEPHANRWLREPDIPVPVGDAIIGTYQDRYIYVLGGQGNNGPVTDVQIYDTDKERWLKATPLASAVFGHAGAILEDTIVYIGGAERNSSAQAPRYVLSNQCWLGKINHKDHTKIEWSKLPDHPGPANFRISAGGSEKDRIIYFAGGADSIYDLKGISLEGKPVEPSPFLFAFDLRSSKWETISDKLPNPIMDQSTLIATTEGLIVVGGMTKGQEITSQVTVLPKTRLLK
jgi:N-acetylneuraminic acid mutarotase